MAYKYSKYLDIFKLQCVYLTKQLLLIEVEDKLLISKDVFAMEHSLAQINLNLLS